MKTQISKWLIVIATFVSIMFVVTGLEAGKPGKPGKPDKTQTEWIVFTGDLVGSEEVEGCCPNAGPFPEYTMTLPEPLGDFAAGEYEGQLFINVYGVGRNQEYIVQFWNEEIAIEIIGGVIDKDKKNKILTVTFTNDMCTDLNTGEDIAAVDFVLGRSY